MQPQLGTIFVCRHCPGAEARLIACSALALGMGWQVIASDCLSGCRSNGAVAVRAPGKTAYLFGPVGQEQLPGLAAFLPLYAASADGQIKDATPLGALRFCALARIPAA